MANGEAKVTVLNSFILIKKSKNITNRFTMSPFLLTNHLNRVFHIEYEKAPNLFVLNNN